MTEESPRRDRWRPVIFVLIVLFVLALCGSVLLLLAPLLSEELRDAGGAPVSQAPAATVPHPDGIRPPGPHADRSPNGGASRREPPLYSRSSLDRGEGAAAR